MDLIENQSHNQNETAGEVEIERMEETLSSPNEEERGFSLRQECEQTIQPEICHTQPQSLMVSPVASSAANKERFGTMTVSHGSRNYTKKRNTTTVT